MYEFVGCIVDDSNVMDNSLQLYWTSDGKTLAEVHDDYKNFYPIDILRDHYMII